MLKTLCLVYEILHLFRFFVYVCVLSDIWQKYLFLFNPYFDGKEANTKKLIRWEAKLTSKQWKKSKGRKTREIREHIKKKGRRRIEWRGGKIRKTIKGIKNKIEIRESRHQKKKEKEKKEIKLRIEGWNI